MLIVFGFGIRDTVGGLMSDQFNTITVYDAIVVTDDLSTDEIKDITNEWNKSNMVKSELQLETTTMTLHNKRNNIDITVMVIPDGTDLGDYIHLKDSVTHKAMSLPSDGIVVTQNAAKQLWNHLFDSVQCQHCKCCIQGACFGCVLFDSRCINNDFYINRKSCHQ